MHPGAIAAATMADILLCVSSCVHFRILQHWAATGIGVADIDTTQELPNVLVLHMAFWFQVENKSTRDGGYGAITGTFQNTILIRNYSKVHDVQGRKIENSHLVDHRGRERERETISTLYSIE